MDEYKNSKVISSSYGCDIKEPTNIKLAIKLSMRLKAPIIPVYCLRNENAIYDIYWDKPIDYKTIINQDSQFIVDELNRLCEKWLLKNMDQWFMLHRLRF